MAFVCVGSGRERKREDERAKGQAAEEKTAKQNGEWDGARLKSRNSVCMQCKCRESLVPHVGKSWECWKTWEGGVEWQVRSGCEDRTVDSI